jgi:tRNA threonylcarbamoyladenosine biosynthesis protein TsaB
VTRLLALETSGNGGSVALLVDGDVTERTIATPREQTDVIVKYIDALLADAGIELGMLDGIAFGRGPGSFTGLRVATAVAQGFGLALGTPLLPVSSMAAVAQRLWREHGVERSLVCIDARMDEVFWGQFAAPGGEVSAVGAERLSDPAAVEYGGEDSWVAAGSGFAAHAAQLAALSRQADRVIANIEPLAQDLLPLATAALAAGRVSSLEEALPAYLRREDAWQR